MNRRAQWISILVTIGLIGLLIWVKWGASAEGLEPTAPSDPYQGTGEESAVQILRVKAVNDIQQSEYVLLTEAAGTPKSSKTKFSFFVDQSISDLSIAVTSEDMAGISVQDSNGRSIEAQSVQEFGNGRVLNFHASKERDNVLWTVEVTAKKYFRFQAKAKSSLQLTSARIVRAGGRPGHSGHFPYTGPLTAGQNELFAFEWSEDLKDARGVLQLISTSGKVLEEGRFSSGFRSAEVELPNESFRVLVKGENKKYGSFQRMDERIHKLGQFELVAFENSRAEPKGSWLCEALSTSSHWTTMTNTSTSSSHIGCVRYDIPGRPELESSLSFLVPFSPQGSPYLTTLFSASYQKLSEADCQNAKRAFASFPQEIIKENRVLKWSFHCEGGPTEFQGVMEATTSAR